MVKIELKYENSPVYWILTKHNFSEFLNLLKDKGLNRKVNVVRRLYHKNEEYCYLCLTDEHSLKKLEKVGIYGDKFCPRYMDCPDGYNKLPEKKILVKIPDDKFVDDYYFEISQLIKLLAKSFPISEKYKMLTSDSDFVIEMDSSVSDEIVCMICILLFRKSWSFKTKDGNTVPIDCKISKVEIQQNNIDLSRINREKLREKAIISEFLSDTESEVDIESDSGMGDDGIGDDTRMGDESDIESDMGTDNANDFSFSQFSDIEFLSDSEDVSRDPTNDFEETALQHSDSQHSKVLHPGTRHSNVQHSNGRHSNSQHPNGQHLGIRRSNLQTYNRSSSSLSNEKQNQFKIPYRIMYNMDEIDFDTYYKKSPTAPVNDKDPVPVEKPPTRLGIIIVI